MMLACRVLLYFPDVWGIFTNGNLVMDAFADAGYTVLGIDYFRGVSRWCHQAWLRMERLPRIWSFTGSSVEAQEGQKRHVEPRL